MVSAFDIHVLLHAEGLMEMNLWLKLHGLYSLFNSSLINTDITIPKT